MTILMAQRDGDTTWMLADQLGTVNNTVRSLEPVQKIFRSSEGLLIGVSGDEFANWVVQKLLKTEQLKTPLSVHLDHDLGAIEDAFRAAGWERHTSSKDGEMGWRSLGLILTDGESLLELPDTLAPHRIPSSGLAIMVSGWQFGLAAWHASRGMRFDSVRDHLCHCMETVIALSTQCGGDVSVERICIRKDPEV